MTARSEKAVRIFLTDTNNDRREVALLRAQQLRHQCCDGITVELAGVDGSTLLILNRADARKLIDAIVEVLPC
jgi:hypothetical protein